MKTLKKLYQKAKSSETNKPDYQALKRIMKSELEKHKDEPTYVKFEWQLPQTHKE